jgi:hypothetical protein
MSVDGIGFARKMGGELETDIAPAARSAPVPSLRRSLVLVIVVAVMAVAVRSALLADARQLYPAALRLRASCAVDPHRSAIVELRPVNPVWAVIAPIGVHRNGATEQTNAQHE